MMIAMRDVVADTFVMLEADMRAGQAREVLNTVQSATHLIVHRAGKKETYYLLKRAAAINELTRARKRSPLADALGLARRKPARVLDADADAEKAPATSIVVEGSQVLGFAQRTKRGKAQAGEQPAWHRLWTRQWDQVSKRGEWSGPWIGPSGRGSREGAGGQVGPSLGQKPQRLVGSRPAPGERGWFKRGLIQEPEGRAESPPTTSERGRFEKGLIEGPRGFAGTTPEGRALWKEPYQPGQQPKGYTAPVTRKGPSGKGLATGPGARAKGSEEGELVTRTLASSFPDRVRVGATRVLRVTLSAAAKTGKGTLKVKAKLGSRITVLVEPERGFELKGDSRGTLKVSATEERLEFKLKATAPGPGLVWVYAYQGVRSLGRMRVLVTVIGASEPLVSKRSQSSRPVPSVDVRQPDLLLEIHQLPSAAGPGIQMYLAAQDPALKLDLRPFPPVSFEKDVEAYYRDIFADIEGMLLDTPEHRQDAQLALESAGYDLFETLFPAELRAQLWALQDRIKTVRIVSNEPWIPWELCKLEDEEHNPGPFLCEAFAVTRWILGVDSQPELKLRKMAVVAPEESGLPHAPEEWAYLQSLAGGSRQVERVPARFAPLLKALGEGVYDGWHFAGHGQLAPGDPNNSTIELDDYQSLKPRNLSGTPLRLGKARPLVFLNACQAGRGAMSLTGMGGWAYKFLSAQAAAFISTHWSIDDEVALEFAKEFYDRLLKQGQSIGEAAKGARLAARAAHPGDPTWLAYVVYADPMAAVQ